MSMTSFDPEVKLYVNRQSRRHLLTPDLQYVKIKDRPQNC